MPASVRAFLFKRAPEGGLSYKGTKKQPLSMFGFMLSGCFSILFIGSKLAYLILKISSARLTSSSVGGRTFFKE